MWISQLNTGNYANSVKYLVKESINRKSKYYATIVTDTLTIEGEMSITLLILDNNCGYSASTFPCPEIGTMLRQFNYLLMSCMSVGACTISLRDRYKVLSHVINHILLKLI